MLIKLSAQAMWIYSLEMLNSRMKDIHKNQLRYAVKAIRNFFVLSNDKRQQYLGDPKRDFTRNRLLNFERTAILVLGLLKKRYP